MLASCSLCRGKVGKRILIVDDGEEVRQVLRAILKLGLTRFAARLRIVLRRWAKPWN